MVANRGKTQGFERLLLAGLAMMAIGCTTSSACPTIPCLPEIRLAYRSALQAPYSISVVVKGMTFEANCPSVASVDPFLGPPGVRSCDNRKLLISGVDLGHGDNQTLPVIVTLDGGMPTPVNLTLTTISNSRDCGLICFVHDGIFMN